MTLNMSDAMIALPTNFGPPQAGAFGLGHGGGRLRWLGCERIRPAKKGAHFGQYVIYAARGLAKLMRIRALCSSTRHST